VIQNNSADTHEKLTDDRLWERFKVREKLSDEQVALFKRYHRLLINANKQINLTTITSLRRILSDHFSDSLAVRNFFDFSKVKVIADVGAGAGFPAIPLKILFPHLKVILIEVTYKKRQFLSFLIDELGLTEDIDICDLDWRTFLRSTEGKVDLFVSRAALDEVELCRLFRHNCPYREAPLIYWASEQWECHKKAAEYVQRIEEYKVGNKQRKLVFLACEPE